MNTVLPISIKEQFEERLMTWKDDLGKFSHLQDNIERNLQTVAEDLDQLQVISLGKWKEKKFKLIGES